MPPSSSSTLPTETTLLTSLLLPPTPLALSLSLPDFRALFPRPAQSDPLIPLLYRELQHQVALGADEVALNIRAEAERGARLAERIRRVRLRREAQLAWEGNDDLLGGYEGDTAEGRWMGVVLENELKTQTLPAYSSPIPTAPHTPSSLVPAMRTAVADLHGEIASLEAQTAALLDEIRTTVGDLSDLRYGKFPNQGSDPEGGDAAREIVEGIRRVEMVCGERMELD